MILSPSLMCADAGHFAEQIAQLEASGADSFHIDIMDGEYVHNFALSWAEVALFRRLTDLPMDAHLMVENLKVHIPYAKKCGLNRVFVHADNIDALNGIKEIHGYKMKAGLAINPDIDIEKLIPFVGLVDALLIMRVLPGFAGQKALDSADARIPAIKKIFPNIEIIVDGAVSSNVISKLLPQGVNGFVLGTSALFCKGRRFSDIMKELRAIE